MLATNGYQSVRNPPFQRYQSTGDFHAGGRQNRSSGYEQWTSAAVQRDSARTVAPLSLSVNQPNPSQQRRSTSTSSQRLTSTSSTQFQMSTAPLPSWTSVPQRHPQQRGGQQPSKNHESASTLQLSATLGRHRRSRETASAGGWYPDEDSVVSGRPMSRPNRFAGDSSIRNGSSGQLVQRSAPNAKQAPSVQDSSAVDPELKKVGKAGDMYHITMSLNAALRQADKPQQQPPPPPPPPRQQQMMISASDTRDFAIRQPPAPRKETSLTTAYTGNAEPVLASTTMIHVRNGSTDDDKNDSVFVTSPSTTLIKLQQPRPIRRPGSSLGIADGGYRIKSVKSMSDLHDIESNVPMTSRRTRRVSPGESIDGTVGFDVQVKNGWRPVSVSEFRTGPVVRHVTQRRRAESSTRSRPVIDGDAPNYTMTLDETMSLNYAPTSTPAPSERRPRRQSISSTMNVVSDSQQQMSPKKPRPKQSPSTIVAAPKLFYETVTTTATATQMTDNEAAVILSPPPQSPAISKILSEQSTQASDPISKSTQTNKARGTQTEMKPEPLDFPSSTRQVYAAPISRSETDVKILDGSDVVNERRQQLNKPQPAVNKRATPSPLSVLANLMFTDEVDGSQLSPVAVAPVAAERKSKGRNVDVNADPIYEFDSLLMKDLELPKSRSSSRGFVEELEVTSSGRTLESAPRPIFIDKNTHFENSTSRQKYSIDGISRNTKSPFGYNGTGEAMNRSDYARLLMKRAPAESVNKTDHNKSANKSADTMVSRVVNASGINRTDYARLLMTGAPPGSVNRKEHKELEETEISGWMLGVLEVPKTDEDSNEVLDMDSVSEKIDFLLMDGVAELKVIVRCERIVPARDTPDLFKKTTVIVTKVIEVDLMVTEARRQLHDEIILNQQRSPTGRLSTADTFDLYQTFVEMAKHDDPSSGNQGLNQHVRIDRQVDEQRFLDLQLSDRKSGRPSVTFDHVDSKLNVTDSSADVDVRAKSASMRRDVLP